MTTAANRDYVSIGQLAARLQWPVRRIEETCAALGIAPAMRINGVGHFDAAQVEQLIQAAGRIQPTAAVAT